MKSLCKTYADRANQLYFTTFLLSNTNKNESPETQFQCLKTKPVLLTASSTEEAVKLKQHIFDYREDDESTADHTAKTAFKSGVFIGKISYHYFTDQELEDVQHWLRSRSDVDDANLSLVPTVCLSFSQILKVNDYNFGVVYRTNEHAIVTDADDNSKEWLIKITHFLVCGPVNGSYYSFIKGTFYAAKTLCGVIKIDAWTGLPK